MIQSPRALATGLLGQVGILSLVCLGVAGGFVASRAGDPVTPADVTGQAAPESSTLGIANPGGSPGLTADGWGWRNLYAPVESSLGDRRRMLQVAAVGMCIALYFMMRKST